LCLGQLGIFLATIMYILAHSPTFWYVVEQIQEGVGGTTNVSKDTKTVGLRQKLVDVESQDKVRIRDVSLTKTAGNIDYDCLATEARRESVLLKAFHFLPIVRYFLLVKDPESNDVESLFRINALSSYTLGFAQVFCMMLGITNGSLHWDVKLHVGVVAQLVNGTMTYLYFFTDHPARMKTQMQVEALQSMTSQLMQEEFVRYNLAAEQCANRMGDEFPKAFDQERMSADKKKLFDTVVECRCKVIRDINQFGNCSLEESLKKFSTTQLFEWRLKLAARNIVAYGRLVV